MRYIKRVMSLPDYDPSRVMPSGETVYQARERLRRVSWELKCQAMAMVGELYRGTRLTIEEVEDEVYARRFGLERFPKGPPKLSKEKEAEEKVAKLPSLEDIARCKAAK